MSDNRFECACEHGLDCTRTTMCELQSISDELEAAKRHITALEAEKAGINYAYENRFQVGMDGDSWYATEYDFINLQESESGWGDTPHEAVMELYEILKQELGHG